MTRTPAPIDRRELEPSLAEFRQSYTLPGVAYTSPELFAWEMRHFFDESWVCLGRSDGLMQPGTRMAVPAGAGTVAAIRHGRSVSGSTRWT